jgi:hypothetical protein
VINHWVVPPGDSDCDAFTDSSESFSGTLPGTKCASTSAANDEAPPDAWPVDFNDDQIANVLDVSTFSSRFNSSAPGPPYGVRFDFNGDGKVNVLDVSHYSSLFGKSCGAESPTPTPTATPTPTPTPTPTSTTPTPTAL